MQAVVYREPRKVEVVEVGDGVDQVKVGDMVCLPFNIGCGHCMNCLRGLTNYCMVAQPEPAMAGAAFGFADMGPWEGGQAELLRVPWRTSTACACPRTPGRSRPTT